MCRRGTLLKPRIVCYVGLCGGRHVCLSPLGGQLVVSLVRVAPKFCANRAAWLLVVLNRACMHVQLRWFGSQLGCKRAWRHAACHTQTCNRKRRIAAIVAACLDRGVFVGVLVCTANVVQQGSAGTGAECSFVCCILVVFAA